MNYRTKEKDNTTKFIPLELQIRDALQQETEAPDKTNKYKKFKTAIDKFYKQHLNTQEVKAIIPISSNDFIPVEEARIGTVEKSSNKLIFGKSETTSYSLLRHY